jgi:hypothetical protein
MKKILILFTLIVFCLTACEKEEDMQVRVKNNYPQALNVTIGPTSYGSVASGAITDYKGVPEGSHQITGDITGSITLEGVGKHKFTITISNTGAITLAED